MARLELLSAIYASHTHSVSFSVFVEELLKLFLNARMFISEAFLQLKVH